MARYLVSYRDELGFCEIIGVAQSLQQDQEWKTRLGPRGRIERLVDVARELQEEEEASHGS